MENSHEAWDTTRYCIDERKFLQSPKQKVRFLPNGAIIHPDRRHDILSGVTLLVNSLI